jgi:hypothetical protein
MSVDAVMCIVKLSLQEATAPKQAKTYSNSKMCLFPTSITKMGDSKIVSGFWKYLENYLKLKQKPHTTSFLRGHSYTYGKFEVGSLDLGAWSSIGTCTYDGVFRSEGVCGTGYFADERVTDVENLPHFLPTREFKGRRAGLGLLCAGSLGKLPKEVRLLIWEYCFVSWCLEGPWKGEKLVQDM